MQISVESKSDKDRFVICIALSFRLLKRAGRSVELGEKGAMQFSKILPKWPGSPLLLVFYGNCRVVVRDPVVPCHALIGQLS